MRVVLVCGDRYWRNGPKIRQVLEAEHAREPFDFLVEGGAEGADLLAEKEGQILGIQTVRCGALWAFYGKKAGPIRNAMQLRLAIALATSPASPIVEKGGKWVADWQKDILVVAFHSDLSKSKGTADMVKKARKAGCRVIVVG